MLVETEYAVDERAENKGQRSLGRRSAKLWAGIALVGMMFVGYGTDIRPARVGERSKKLGSIKRIR